MRKDRPEWQLFLEEISIPISKSELSDPLKLAIVLEIFQKVFKSVEEKRCVINWIRQMSDHLGTYVSNGRNEIQMLDEQLKTLYLKIDNLKHNFRENPDKITMELSFTNQKISTLKDKKYLFARNLSFWTSFKPNCLWKPRYFIENKRRRHRPPTT